MRKIIISAAVAAMALSTTASALEDIKVNGQAKVWYETSDTNDGDIFSKDKSSAEVVFKLGMTGKQGNVGFGAEVTQGSSMGLENVLVSGVRTDTTSLSPNPATDKNQGDMYVSKAYITVPAGADTTIKMGRQELNTPLAFTEKWNAQQNNFDALVAINNSINNLTLIGAYVGQTNTAGTFKATQEFNQLQENGAFALGALFKNDAVGVNVWAYNVTSVADAVWADASMKAGPIALKAYAATMLANDAVAPEDTTAFALSAGMKAGAVNLFAAASMVSEDNGLPVGNVATGFKKTKLPTAGVYTDGLFVAQPGSTAFKVKASGKLGTTGLALQAVMNQNDYGTTDALETTEVDLIATQKVGDVNLKGILMYRVMGDDAWDNSSTAAVETTSRDDQQGGIYARVIASVNF